MLYQQSNLRLFNTISEFYTHRIEGDQKRKAYPAPTITTLTSILFVFPSRWGSRIQKPTRGLGEPGGKRGWVDLCNSTSNPYTYLISERVCVLTVSRLLSQCLMWLSEAKLLLGNSANTTVALAQVAGVWYVFPKFSYLVTSSLQDLAPSSCILGPLVLVHVGSFFAIKRAGLRTVTLFCGKTLFQCSDT